MSPAVIGGSNLLVCILIDGPFSFGPISSALSRSRDAPLPPPFMPELDGYEQNNFTPRQSIDAHNHGVGQPASQPANQWHNN